MSQSRYNELSGIVLPVDDQVQIGSTLRPIKDIQAKTATLTGAVATGALTVTGAVTATGAITGSSFVPVVSGLTPSGSILLYSKFKTGGTPWFQPDGTNTKDIMDSFTLPGGTLTTGHKLRFTVYGVHTGANTNSCVVAITVGGTIAAYQTTLADGTDIVSQSMAVSGGIFSVYTEMYQLEATVQRAFSQLENGGTTLLVPQDVSLTQDMTASKSFILSLKNVTTTTDASIYGWTVELV